MTLTPPPRGENPSHRVDAIPLQILAALLELGLHPAALQLSAQYNVMLRAWDGLAPKALPTPPKAHIDRQLLDGALAELAERTRGLRLHHSVMTLAPVP